MAVATLFSTQMALITGNAGGVIQQLPTVTQAGARERVFIANIAYNAQAVGSVFAVARLPLGSIITGITVLTDTSTGSATLSLGDANNAALYSAATAYTGVNTPTKTGLAATHGSPITTGYDALTGAAVTPQKPGQGGAFYEDILMTVAAAALPAGGNLVIIFEYALD